MVCSNKIILLAFFRIGFVVNNRRPSNASLCVCNNKQCAERAHIWYEVHSITRIQAPSVILTTALSIRLLYRSYRAGAALQALGMKMEEG